MSSSRDTVDETFLVNFNHDCTSLTVGSECGFKMFALTSVDHSLKRIYCNYAERIRLVERHFNSSLVVFVSLDAPRTLKILHVKKQTIICTYSYPNPILAVKLAQSRLVVCLMERLYVHDLCSMNVLYTIRDTVPNETGLIALTSGSDQSYLAYPGSTTEGEVQIFDAINLCTKRQIDAHESPLSAIAFNRAGTAIATASEKGTVIRMFSVNDGSKLFEFRRGLQRHVAITSLTFSVCSDYLCCSSNTETVHIFKLKQTTSEDEQYDEDSWMGYIGRTVTEYLSQTLPSAVTDVFTQDRAFSRAVLPVAGLSTSSVVTTIQNVLRLLVASQDGYLYVFQIPLEGGECLLYQKYDLRSLMK
ncbi:WD repeat domain phosphoinositide-interacting protein 2-like [Armigeres subalbatus]|uniref:WD repeat domain phosphoinositide-interacting protein 2-like n=1 Tax=Armigeres subalbatus TaxID=124917 RepID=UPI002ED570B5